MRIALQLCVLTALTLGPADNLAAEVESVHPVDILQAIRDEKDVKPVGETLEIVVPRNGTASGMVVVRGRGLHDLDVGIEPRGEHAGPPAEAWRIFYAHKRNLREPHGWKVARERREAEKEGEDPDEAERQFRRLRKPFFDPLLETPLEEKSEHFLLPAGDLLPVVVQVSLPRDTAPATYGYSLRIGGKAVPVDLKVSPYLAPDPEDYTVYSGFAWSEMNVARRYGVEPWSAEHWRLVERELALLGALGNKPLVVTVLPDNYLSEEHAKVRFRKEGGAYVPDFTIVDRYLDLYQEHVGQPRPLILHLWNMAVYGLTGKHAKHPARPLSEVQVPLSVIKQDGSLAVETVPPPHRAGPGAPWGRLLEGMQERIAARGWPADCLLLGTPSDQRPRVETVEAFREIAPDIHWAIFGHWHATSLEAHPDLGYWQVPATGLRVGHMVKVWAPELTWPRQEGIIGGWNRPLTDYSSMRNYLGYYVPFSQWRMLPDGSCVTGRRDPEGKNRQTDIFRRTAYAGGQESPSAGGFARVPFDFWLFAEYDMVLHRGNDLYETDLAFPGIVRANSPWLIYSGPQGPVPTIRYEMLREGLQECEARITIERALLGHPDALGEPLRRECVDFLGRRIKVISRSGRWEFYGGLGYGQPNTHWGVAEDWRAMTATLFQLAARVQGLVAR